MEMNGHLVLFLCLVLLVECAMCIAEDRPHQYHEKEGNKLTRTTQNKHMNHLGNEKETNQTHIPITRASNLSIATSDVIHPKDGNKTYSNDFQTRATLSVDLPEEESKIRIAAKHLFELIRERDRRSATNLTKSTPADITSLFEDKRVTSTSHTNLVEGGGEPVEHLATSILSSLEQTSMTTSHPTSITTKILPIEDNVNVSRDIMQSKVTNEDPKYHKTVPRKGAEVAKIVGRKGVDEEISVTVTTSNAINASTHNESTNISLSQALADDLSVNGDMPSEMVSPSMSTPLPLSNLSNLKEGIIESYPPLKKKPKPLKLSDTTSFDTSPVPHDHVPSQRDIVLPVVGLILAVPMIFVLGVFLYKKGSEYWSRRHYRRMDFLIDGMYND